jgi:multiple antibiotic resistance protein
MRRAARAKESTMAGPDASALAFFSKAFPAIFSIVDPIAAAPLFLALVARESDADRRGTAIRATITMVLVLAIFAAAGSAIFKFFGITVPAFKIAGGLLLFATAFDMVRAKHGRDARSTPDEEREALEKADVAIIPLGIPLLSGPGAIATAMLWSGRAHGASQQAALYASILVVGAITVLSLLFAQVLMRVLGQTGINIATRVMGLILAATAAQFVVDGVSEVVHPQASPLSMGAPAWGRDQLPCSGALARMRSPKSQTSAT